MIIPDVNLLVYAYNTDAPAHVAARAWWEEALSAPRPVGLPWAVSLSFVRVMSNAVALPRPVAPQVAVAHVRTWLEQANVRVLVPGPRHLDLLEHLLSRASATSKLTTDAHLAALAIENQAELHSSDVDFARFPGLSWVNPLA